ncbi:sugar phosphate isomerase/epimerase family protein [Chloroflexota bacterium]
MLHQNSTPPVVPLLTFSTGSLYLYSLDRAFALAAEYGFDGVEVMCDHRYDSRQPDNLRRLMNTHQLPVSSLHTPLRGWGLPGWQDGQIAALEQTVALAEAINAAHVVCHLPSRIWFMTFTYAARSWKLPACSIHTDYKRWIEQGGLAVLQAQTPVHICIENIQLITKAPKGHWLTWWNTLVEWPQVHDYLTLDTSHWATHGIDPLTAYQAAGGGVRHIHLSNTQDSQDHLPPQTGDLDLAAFMRQLAGDGFDGHIVVELNPHTLHSWDEARTRTLLAETVEFCRAALAVEPSSVMRGNGTAQAVGVEPDIYETTVG